MKGQDDPVHLEEDARIANLGRKLIGKVGDQVLGQPGVHLLIREDRLPRGLVDDIVAKLQALGHEMLGPEFALGPRQAHHLAVVRRLVGQRKPDGGGDGRHNRQEDSRSQKALGWGLEHRGTHRDWKGQNGGKRPAHGREESGCRLGGPDVLAVEPQGSIRRGQKTVNPEFASPEPASSQSANGRSGLRFRPSRRFRPTVWQLSRSSCAT